jgi:UDP-glucuronate decarboxylase
MDYFRVHNVDVRIIRIFNTYGPRMAQHDGRVVSNFVVQALQGKDITVYGTGEQTRSFCYVDDLIEGMVRYMALTTENGMPGPINLGNPGEFTMNELAEKVIKLTGSKSRILHQPLPQDDPKQRRPDITVAKTVLYWEPEILLNQGLEKTIDYFRNIL